MKSSFHACPQGGTFAVYCLISVFLCLIALPGSFAEPLCESYSTNSCPSPRCMVWDDMCLENCPGGYYDARNCDTTNYCAYDGVNCQYACDERYGESLCNAVFDCSWDPNMHQCSYQGGFVPAPNDHEKDPYAPNEKDPYAPKDCDMYSDLDCPTGSNQCIVFAGRCIENCPGGYYYTSSICGNAGFCSWDGQACQYSCDDKTYDEALCGDVPECSWDANSNTCSSINENGSDDPCTLLDSETCATRWWCEWQTDRCVLNTPGQCHLPLSNYLSISSMSAFGDCSACSKSDCDSSLKGCYDNNGACAASPGRDVNDLCSLDPALDVRAGCSNCLDYNSCFNSPSKCYFDEAVWKCVPNPCADYDHVTCISLGHCIWGDSNNICEVSTEADRKCNMPLDWPIGSCNMCSSQELCEASPRGCQWHQLPSSSFCSENFCDADAPDELTCTNSFPHCTYEGSACKTSSCELPRGFFSSENEMCRSCDDVDACNAKLECAYDNDFGLCGVSQCKWTLQQLQFRRFLHWLWPIVRMGYKLSVLQKRCRNL